MRTFTDFCAYLGCPLVNSRWSWSALSADGRRAVFTVWSDEVRDRKYVLHPVSERRPGVPEEADSRLGALEVERIAAAVAADPSIEAFGILSIAKDPKATPRVRESYDDDTLFRLKVVHEDGVYVAHLVARPAVRDVVNKA